MAYVRRVVTSDATWQRAWTADAVSDLASIHTAGLAKHGDVAFVTANSNWYVWMDDGTWRPLSPTSLILGDIFYVSAANTVVRLPGNITTSVMVLTQTGDGALSTAPAWAVPPVAGVNTYMLANAASDISTYFQMVSLPSFTSAAQLTTTTSVSTAETLLGVFATNVSFPNLTLVPVGLFTGHYDTEKAAGAINYYSYFKIYKRTSGGTETLVATSDVSSQSAVNTRLNITVTAPIITGIVLLSTDRLVVKIYAKTLSSTSSINLYADGTSPITAARLEFPSSTVDATNFVPYTGATLNVDLGSKTFTTSGVISGIGSGLTGLSAGNISTGVLATARGGTSVDIASAALPLGSGQITFPATQSASAGVNTLDDYEEGTFTPTITGANGGSGQTYSVQEGHYIKIGKLVHLSGAITLTAAGTITGQVVIASLPFTSDTTTAYRSLSPINWNNLATAFVLVQGVVGQNSTVIGLVGATVATTGIQSQSLLQADMANNSRVVFSLSYTATA